MRTHQISSSGYVSADKLHKLYKTNLEDAQRDLKTTPVDIDGVSLKSITREKIAEEIAKKTAEIIAKQNAKSIEEKNIEKNKKQTNSEDNFVLKFSPEEINEMLWITAMKNKKKLRPFFTSDHIYCLFDAFSQGLHNVARNGSPRYAGLLRQIASKSAILQDFDQQLFWRTFTGGVLHRHISVKSEPEKDRCMAIQ